MIEAVGITLREAIEAILVIFIMAAYFEKTDETEKKKHVYVGAIAAVFLSVVLAVILTVVGINPENELVEGVMFFLAGTLVASLVVWMWRKSKVMKQEIETKVATATSGFALASIAFVMVFREGVETVIFLQSLLLTGSSPVGNFLGALVGIALALVFGIVFLKGTGRINLSRFFKVTSAILAVLVIKLIASGFHEFFELELLPSNESIMEVVGFLAKDSTGAAVIAFMLFTLIAMLIYDVARASQPDLSYLAPAERRREKYQFLKEKYSKIALGSVLLLVMMIILTPTINASDVAVPKPVLVEAKDGLTKVEVPKENGLYRYSFDEARFLVAVKNGKPHVALDVCYICPPKGYGYDGEVLVCLNCEAPIPPETVGTPGGCNPYIIDYTIKNGNVIIDADKLLKAWGEA